MKILIDNTAGVCPGVARAIRLAEEKLQQGVRLVSIGPLIHNPVEIERLAQLGLITVPQEIFEKDETWAQQYAGAVLLVRTHGISQKLRQKLLNQHFELLDATCPKVKRVQDMIHQYSGQDYQIVIVGKKDHPEVIGLAGAAVNQPIVILDPQAAQHIPANNKTLLVAQTTTNQENFLNIGAILKQRINGLEIKNTICNAVNQRHQRLQKFAPQFDSVLFVGGRHSSNTRELFRICQTANPRSYWIERFDETDSQWLREVESVGISGSASTPYWQLEQIQSHLENISHDSFTKIKIKEV